MKFIVDFFKPSGKWYSGCEIESELNLWDDNFKQEIVNKQNALMEGWQGNYFVVTDDTSENDFDNNYKGFYKRHFMPWDFIGIKKI